MDINEINEGTKLNHVTTVVKDNLPTQQDIDAEKNQADGSGSSKGNTMTAR